MKKNCCFLVLVLMVFVVSGCKNEGKTVAQVNDGVISIQDLNDEIDNLPAEYRMMAQSPDMKKRILDNLVITELLLQSAEKEGLLKDPEIQKAIREKEIQIKAEADAQIYSFKRQKENANKIAKREVVLKEMLDDKNFENKKIDEKELVKFYEQYANMMKQSNPNTKVESYATLKDDIKRTVIRQKWIEGLKNEAKITINEELLGSQMPVIGIPDVQKNIEPEKVEKSK
ncbi:MAG: SurA N-terminal domain-containing protein [Candidatus Goldbacteria bacterium]|nr:SurA N-terminal domain-containing protein [Candidatus Goldiibacteriota bacterium]HPD18090.1 SurA N-terminal domain-containing protein [Candidatus Goldiibacteriota bacterium]